MPELPEYSVFQGERLTLSGTLEEVIRHLKEVGESPHQRPLVFENRTGRTADLNLHGTADEAVARALRAQRQRSLPKPAAPGRPEALAREVQLLPRHWEWLDTQRGGASATLRRLVDEARKANPQAAAAAQAKEATDRFMFVMAGDQAGYEEAGRALYAGNRAAFLSHTAGWPADIREQARKMAGPALHAEE
ncbi:DUF2239 family protein [Deinococcus lacus]|uniref:DUF2239 family protein n=1 Tax=Deinococcus lacus TaxID=392561 RepID=A0ABW1YBH7_9DEIO